MQILFPSFGKEVLDVLNINGIPYSIDGNSIVFPSKGLRLVLVQLPAPEQPGLNADERHHAGYETFWLYEDRWKSSKTITTQRLLSRLGIFQRLHARLCNVVSVNNCKDYGITPEAFQAKVQKFLDAFHTYGYLKGQKDYLLIYKGDIVAAAQFMHTYDKTGISGRQVSAVHEQTIPASQPNSKQPKLPGNKQPQQADRPQPQHLHAYEWTRYASLPDVRIAGGMGKVLNQFLSDVDKHSSPNAENTSVKPHAHVMIEVMSYSDNEWSNGDAYRKLGFKLAGTMEPVTYRIDPKTWKRINPRQWEILNKCIPDKETANYATIQNHGSRKWVLRLSDGGPLLGDGGL